jgi:phage shock protein C
MEENAMNGYYDNGPHNPIRLYRDTANARVAGVCAGFAKYLDIRVKIVRIGMILGLVFAFWIFAPAYVILALVLKPMPRQMFASPQEEQFWRRVSRSPNQMVGELKGRLRSLDRRLADIERSVTSDEFDLHRKFRDLKA